MIVVISSFFHPLVLPSSSVDACQMVFYHPIYKIVRESAALVGRGLCSLVCFTQCLVCLAQCLVCHTAVRLDSHTMVCLVSNAVSVSLAIRWSVFPAVHPISLLVEGWSLLLVEGRSFVFISFYFSLEYQIDCHLYGIS